MISHVFNGTVPCTALLHDKSLMYALSLVAWHSWRYGLTRRAMHCALCYLFGCQAPPDASHSIDSNSDDEAVPTEKPD